MIPLFEILFFIAVNLVPADVPSFSIAEDGKNKIQFIRQNDGGWEVKEPKERSGTWRLDATKVSVTRTDGGSETDLAQQFTIPTNANWRTLKEIHLGQTTIRIGRQPAGAKITFGDGGDAKQHEIQWPKIKK